MVLLWTLGFYYRRLNQLTHATLWCALHIAEDSNVISRMSFFNYALATRQRA